MIECNILAIEDDYEWIENYKLMLEEYPFNIDSATTAEEGISKLSKKHYRLVLLDLSLDPSNTSNRDSELIQKYLKGSPNGIQYIVVSALTVVNVDDVRIAAFKYNAFGVLTKAEVADNKKNLVNKVLEAIKYSSNIKPDFLLETYETLIGKGDQKMRIEFNLTKTLKKSIPIIENYVKNRLIPIINPIKLHKTRHSLFLDKENNFVSGLYWSCKLGKPISLCLFNENISSLESIIEKHKEWLGWSPGVIIKQERENNLHIIFFNEENNIGIKEFNLH